MDKKTENLDTLDFEAALAELEAIVSALEKGEVKLEKSIALYERGTRLKARLEAILDNAKERVEAIDAQGRPAAWHAKAGDDSQT